MDVFLYDALLVVLKLTNIGNQVNASASAQVSWLADPYLLLIRLSELFHKLLVLIGKDECRGSEVIDASKYSLK
jgi:hypothetical protein